MFASRFSNEVQGAAPNISASPARNSDRGEHSHSTAAIEGWVFAFCDFNLSIVAFSKSPPPGSIYATLQAAKQHCYHELNQMSRLKKFLILLFLRFETGTAIVNDIMVDDITIKTLWITANDLALLDYPCHLYRKRVILSGSRSYRHADEFTSYSRMAHHVGLD